MRIQMIKMGFSASALIAALTLAGCAAQAGAVKNQSDPRVEELERKQQQMTLRMEELTQRLLDMQARLDHLEEQAARPVPPPEPKLEVVRLEPPAAMQTAAPQAPTAQTVKAPDLKPVAAEAGEKPPVAAPLEVAQQPAAQGAEKRMVVEQDAPTKAYKEAYILYRKGEYAKAILDFEDFIGRYPTHEFADSAQFWLGESYYSQGVFEQAIVEFGKVVDNYPAGKRAPDAHLMIGECYMKLGQPERAMAIYNKLIAQYPASEAAYMAKKRIKTP